MEHAYLDKFKIQIVKQVTEERNTLKEAAVYFAGELKKVQVHKVQPRPI